MVRKASGNLSRIVAASLALLCSVQAFSPSPLSQHIRSFASVTAPPQNHRAVRLHVTESDTNEETAHPLRSPTPTVVSFFQKLANNPSTVVASMAIALALLSNPNNADAAMSGGRMGGSFSSSPRQSISRPMPSRSSYGGSSSYGGGSYYSRPSVTIVPSIGGGGYYSPFYSPFANPFFAPRPLMYGGGPGVISISRGPSLLDLLVVGGVGYVMLSAFQNAVRERNEVVGNTAFWSETANSILGPGTSVAQISVALNVSNRDDPNSILSVLERLSQTARTDSRVGIQNLTSQVALELLRRKSSIVSGHTRYTHFRDTNKAQREFNSMSVKERSKFEQEGTSKFGGVDYSSQRSANSALNNQATVAVVTLNLAIDGDSTKLPQINSLQDVEQALRKIAADVKVDDCLQSAEILWTPEDRTETLTLKDVVADYPELRAV